MFFVVFEGIDGSGKSTLMKMLDQHLKDLSFSTIITREPGGTVVGDQLRDLILKKTDQPPAPRAELLMYQASRAQHVDLVIRPALENKKWVLCDRFSASSVAFQGGGRGISQAQVEWLNDFSTNSLNPHLTVLLDLSIEESQKRRSQRSHQTGAEEDRIEAEKDEFHERVRQSFLQQAEASLKNGQNDWLVLNASQSPEKLFEILIQTLKSKSWISR